MICQSFLRISTKFTNFVEIHNEVFITLIRIKFKFRKLHSTFLDMGTWSFWLILGVGFLIAEVLTVSTTCLYLGLGALAAMCAAFMGGDWLATIVTFIAATSLLYLLTYKWRDRLLRLLHKGAAHTATGMDALIGRTSIVEDADTLRIRIDGDLWQVRPAKSENALHPGEKVRVVGYESIILTVEPMAK